MHKINTKDFVTRTRTLTDKRYFKQEILLDCNQFHVFLARIISCIFKSFFVPFGFY